MDQKTLDDVIENALQKDGGEYLWSKLNAASISASGGYGPFHDPMLLKEVQRFMEKNRLPIALSISRYALYRAVTRLRALLNSNTEGENSCMTDSLPSPLCKKPTY